MKNNINEIPNSVIVAGVFLLKDYLDDNGIFFFKELDDEKSFTKDQTNCIYTGAIEKQPFQYITNYFKDKEKNLKTLQGFFPGMAKYDSSYLEKANKISGYEAKRGTIHLLQKQRMFESATKFLMENIEKLAQSFLESQAHFLSIISNSSHYNIEMSDDFCLVYRTSVKNAKFLYNKNIESHRENFEPVRKKILDEFKNYLKNKNENSFENKNENNLGEN